MEPGVIGANGFWGGGVDSPRGSDRPSIGWESMPRSWLKRDLLSWLIDAFRVDIPMTYDDD